MFTFLTPYKIWLELAMLVAFVGLVAIAVHHYNSWQQGIGEARIEAKYVERDKIAAEAQRVHEIQMQKDVDDARLQAAQARQQAVVTATAAANSGRVFSATLAKMRSDTGAATREALAANVTTLTAVLDSCQTRYRAMGQAAQGHADDSLMYQKAWPINSQPGMSPIQPQGASK